LKSKKIIIQGPDGSQTELDSYSSNSLVDSIKSSVEVVLDLEVMIKQQ
jgi:hypothetical protein